MVAFQAENKGKRHAQQRCDAMGRQAIGFGLVKIDDEADRGAGARVGVQQADASGFDHAGKLWRAGGDKLLSLRGDLGLVVSDERGSVSDQLQSERGFARARSADDQHTAPIHRHATGVHQRLRHTGRPTTNRAPSGSEVGSALVGRMFSAQITPPCASTICLLIDRPRPELLPK
ncbi:MAG: hypothetical protein JWS10_1429 [Cypionkella sp.]|nr:hypothetical protein [Cypionkella sp.]